MVKIEEGTEAETIAQLQTFYQEYNQGLPLDYTFLDQDYSLLYAAEQRVAILSKYFASVAIVISCFGLFGLAAFTCERRLKEISVRKILGSTEFGIVYLLSGEFTKLVFASALIALPISYLITRNWLNSFAFRIDLQVWFFIGAGLIAFVIAWITIGIQTVKAARSNPASNLRTE